MLGHSCCLFGLLVAMTTMRSSTSQESTPLADINSEFALELYKALHKDHPENIFFSPFSISTCLAMTYLGARNDTAQQMSRVLRFHKMDASDLHMLFHDLLTQLHHSDRPYILKTANRLFGQNSFEFVQKFLDETSRHYRAQLAPVDFHGNTEGARQTINSWVEEQTENKIQDLLAPGTVSPSTMLVLVNAIYFKGSWESKFEESRTRLGTFHVSRDEKVEVPMMHQQGRFKLTYDEDLNCQILEMPYRGKHLSMVVVLPEKMDDLSVVETSLTPDLLRRWRKSMSEESTMVQIPKFKLVQDFSLNEKLAEMGMTDLFSMADADLSGITGSRDLHVSHVIHKAFVEVNEEGSEAAAATAVNMMKRSLGGEMFFADHPFLFLIRDNDSNSVLFLGRLVRPEGHTTKDEL
ncbi:leukocyte elastase inhibitor-like [Branchiostoma floridae]|uniref:Leukocyte elastase inhibitor-like n=1 Tax=Branchiostoma floridae TaxID=7739 RepID=A0A9J7M372_BRAFL|nr:leukocyte elastase inhibitor-like [Branchiostoma floridae]